MRIIFFCIIIYVFKSKSLDRGGASLACQSAARVEQFLKCMISQLHGRQ